MIRVPGLGIARGMGLTLRRFFEPKATIKYPEVPADVSTRFRGRRLSPDRRRGRRGELAQRTRHG